MLCSERSLVNYHEGGAVAISLKCRAWTCPICRPERQKRLIREAMSGEPTRFVTLTSRPRINETPAQRAAALARAWRLICARWRRLHGEKLQYLAVLEATKRGEPHLHVLVRSKLFLPQRWLSDQTRDILNAPIVDIRAITNGPKAAAYVAKYIGKEPHRFGGSKRYWKTQGYTLKPEDQPEIEPWTVEKWTIDERPLWLIEQEWQLQNKWPANVENEVVYYGLPPPWVRSMMTKTQAPAPQAGGARRA